MAEFQEDDADSLEKENDQQDDADSLEKENDQQDAPQDVYGGL